MEQKKKKKSIPAKIFGGLGVASLWMASYILLQIIAIYIIMIAWLVWEVVNNTSALETIDFNAKLTDPEFLTLLTCIGTVVSALYAALLYWALYGRKSKRTEEIPAKIVWKPYHIATVFVAAIAGYCCADCLAEFIGFISPSTMESFNENMENALGGNVFLGTVASVIFAPIGEECIMRGLMKKWLEKYFSPVIVIVLSGIFFGIFHMNLVQGIYAIPLGVLFAYIAYRSNSVLPCIFAHLLNNGFSTILEYLVPAKYQPLWAYILGLVLAGILVYLMNRKITELPKLMDLQKQELEYNTVVSTTQVGDEEVEL